jgi:hypothetical protein
VSDDRTITMNAEQAADLELYILQLMRSGENERASRMMNLTLSWKFAKPAKPPLPENVVEIDKHSRKVPAA